MLCPPSWPHVQRQAKRSTIVTNIKGRLECKLGGGEIRLEDKNVGPRTSLFPRYMMVLFVVLQRLCKMLVFPAFALPIIRTRNCISGIWRRGCWVPIGATVFGKQELLIDLIP